MFGIVCESRVSADLCCCSGNPLHYSQKCLVDHRDAEWCTSEPSPKLLQYLRDVSGQSEKPTSVRVLLLGRDGVGKSKTLEALGTPVGFVDRLFVPTFV